MSQREYWLLIKWYIEFNVHVQLYNGKWKKQRIFSLKFCVTIFFLLYVVEKKQHGRDSFINKNIFVINLSKIWESIQQWREKNVERLSLVRFSNENDGFSIQRKTVSKFTLYARRFGSVASSTISIVPFELRQ